MSRVAAVAPIEEAPPAADVDPLRPRLRPDVSVRRQVQGDQEFTIVRNPDTQQYYRFGDNEYAVLSLLDGSSTAEEIAELFRENTGRGIGVGTVKAFVDSMRRLNLIERSPEEKRLALYERLREQRKRRHSAMSSILFIKKKLADPDRLFGRWLEIFGFFWTPTFVWFSLALSAAAVLVLILNWRAFASDYGTFLFGLYDLDHAVRNYIFLLSTWFWMTVIHESAHGITCKHFGGEVHEVGILLLYLQMLGCYCNVNDAWNFPKRSQRLWVTFAGGYSGIVLAVVAVFVWWLSPPASLLQKNALAVITIGFLGNVLSNFNPLIKLDGYYMLLDYLDVANLQGNSWKQIGYLFKRYVLRLPVEPLEASPRARRIYITYGVLSFLYIATMMGFLVVILGGLFFRKFGEVGWLLFLPLAAMVLQRPARPLAAAVRFFFTDKRETLRSPKLLLRIGLVLSVVLALLFLTPLPFRVKGTGIIEPRHRVPVHARVAGRVEEVAILAGADVREGQLLIRLSNPPLDREAERAVARAREVSARLALAEARGRPGEAQLLRQELEMEEQAAEGMLIRANSLRVRAPADGVLHAPWLRDARGRAVAAGQLLAEVFAPGARRVHLRVPERLVGDVAAGSAAQLKVATWPSEVFEGRVLEVLPDRAPDDRMEAEAAAADPSLVPQAWYHVLAEFEDPDGRLPVGALARVRIDCGRLTPAGYLARFARRFFGGKMWL